MICPHDKILNHCSNRCVNKTGKVGKKVIARNKRILKRRYISPTSSSSSISLSPFSPEFSDIVYNTVMIDNIPFHVAHGEIPYSIDMSYYNRGIEVLPILHRFTENGNLVPVPNKSISEDYFKNLYIDFVSSYGIEPFKIYKNMKLLRHIDRGVFGDIYSIKYDNEITIIKMEERQRLTTKMFKKKIEKEYYIQDVLSTKAQNHALPILDIHIFQYLSNVISMVRMKRLDIRRQYTLHDIFQVPNISDSFFEILKNQLRNIVHILCSLDIVHGDMHWKNVYLTYTGKLAEKVNISNWKEGEIIIGLIDFGYSELLPCNPEIEYLALMRSSYEYNIRTTDRLLYIVRELMFERNIPCDDTDVTSINRRYIELFRELQNL